MRLRFQIWLALWPLFLAVLLPLLTPPWHFISLSWGYLYGLGFGLVHVLGGIDTPWALFGLLVWPILISALLFWAGGILWRKKGRSGARWVVVIVLISGLISATENFLIAHRSLWFPNYSVYVATIDGPKRQSQ